MHSKLKLLGSIFYDVDCTQITENAKLITQELLDLYIDENSFQDTTYRNPFIGRPFPNTLHDKAWVIWYKFYFMNNYPSDLVFALREMRKLFQPLSSDEIKEKYIEDILILKQTIQL